MKLIAFILISGWSIHAFSQDLWISLDSIKGAPRSVASSFVLYGEGYTIAGLDDSGFRRRAYAYNYAQDDWDNKPSLGGDNGSGLNRGSASSFAIGNKGYVCLGQGETNPFFKDLWEYDPVIGSWTQKADFIGSSRRQAVAFAIDSFAYVGTGYDASGFTKDMYKYHPATNTWTQVSDFGGTARKEAVGFAMGGQGYVGTGDDGVLKNDFWQYDPVLDVWEQKANAPCTPRKGAVGWGVFPQAFICSGEDINFNYTSDVWEYNYYSNSWTQRASLPAPGRSNAFAFVIQNIAFVGSGYNGEFLDDFYAYSRLLGVDENEITSGLHIYPNPAKNTFQIKTEVSEYTLNVYGMDGKIIHQEIVHQANGTHPVTLNSPSSGIYLVQIEDKESGRLQQEKIVIE